MVGLLWFIVLVLLAVWIAGLVLHFIGSYIWVLFAVAIVLAIYNLVAGGRAVA